MCFLGQVLSFFPQKKQDWPRKSSQTFYFYFILFFYYYEATPCTLLSCAKCMLRARVMSAACCRPTRPEHAEDEWRLWLAANMLLWKPHPFPLRHRTLLSAPLTSNALLRSYSWFDAPSDSNGAPNRKKSEPVGDGLCERTCKRRSFVRYRHDELLTKGVFSVIVAVYKVLLKSYPCFRRMVGGKDNLTRDVCSFVTDTSSY